MRTAYPISAVTALVSVALTACSGGDTSSPDTTTHTATISMAQALASDKEATHACKTLLGDGKQLATWADLTGTNYRVAGARGVKGEVSERAITCSVTDTTEPGNRAYLKLFGPGSSEYFTHEVDEGSNHDGANVVSANNAGEGTAVLSQDVAALNETPATQQIQRMAESLTR